MKIIIFILIGLMNIFFLHAATPKRRRGKERRICTPKFVLKDLGHEHFYDYPKDLIVDDVYGILNETWTGSCILRESPKKCAPPKIIVKYNNAIVHDGHPRIKLHRRKWSVDISIKNVKHSDEGEISCESTGSGEYCKRADKMKLIIKVTDCVPRFVPSIRNLTIPKLSAAVIKCDIDTSHVCPSPVRHYYFNDQPLEMSNLKYDIDKMGLLIYYFKNQDVGRYRCDYFSSYGNSSVTYNLMLGNMTKSTARIQGDLLPVRPFEGMKKLYFLPVMTLKDERVHIIRKWVYKKTFRVFFSVNIIGKFVLGIEIYHKEYNESNQSAENHKDIGKVLLRKTDRIRTKKFNTKCPRDWNYRRCFYVKVTFIDVTKLHSGKYTCVITLINFPNERLIWSYNVRNFYNQQDDEEY